MKRLFLTALFATCATPALAQTPGTWTVGDQGAVWTTPSAKPTGSAPADSSEPALVALPNSETVARWTVSTGDQLYTSRCIGSTNAYYKNSSAGSCTLSGGGTILNMGEKKIRLTCGPATAKRKDNLLGYGIRYFGHGHQGYGAIDWDENSSYTTLRTDPKSSCVGIILNASNYMEPALEVVTTSGATMSVQAQDQAVYYVEGLQNEANTATWIRRGMAWLWGSPPSDYNDTKRRAEYAAASLSYPGTANTPAGVTGWYCIDGDGANVAVTSTYGVGGGTTNARFLKGPGGQDPWNGGCHSTAAGPATLVSDLLSPDCWDRTNLTAADARGHMRYASDPFGARICPKTSGGVDWGRIPQGEVKNLYRTTGFSEYGIWKFSSDHMRMATTECPDAANPCDGVSGGNVPATVGGVFYSRVSLSPCRSTGLDFCNGETLHADYTFAWHSPTFEIMERECLGLTVRGTAPTDGPAECNAGQMDRYTALAYSPPSGASVWTGGCTTNYECRDSIPTKPKERYAIIEGQNAGTVVLKHPGM
jgi:hypothetical protein